MILCNVDYGFNDVKLFMANDLSLFFVYLRYMQHDYGYSNRSEKRLNLGAHLDSEEESKVLEHIEYHLHRFYGDKLFPGVLKALADQKLALEYFIEVLPEQKKWLDNMEKVYFIEKEAKKAWPEQPLLKFLS